VVKGQRLAGAKARVLIWFGAARLKAVPFPIPPSAALRRWRRKKIKSKVEGSGQECPLYTSYAFLTTSSSLACGLGASSGSVEFFGHPVLEGGHVLRAAQEVLYQVIG
jgi:hypothetical protein